MTVLGALKLLSCFIDGFLLPPHRLSIPEFATVILPESVSVGRWVVNGILWPACSSSWIYGEGILVFQSVAFNPPFVELKCG